MSDTRVAEILGERKSVHGDARVQFDGAQALKSHLRRAQASQAGPRLDTMQMEALEMIMVKISRILVGDPSHRDHWDDIAGYATLVSNDLAKRGK